MRAWTHAEEEALRILSPLGRKACAEAFERSEVSVVMKAHALGFSLRRREGFETDSKQTVESVMKLIRQAALANLCPACALRPIGVRRTGLCGRCHVEALKSIHEEQIARVDATLALEASRSKLNRRRRALERSGIE